MKNNFASTSNAKKFLLALAALELRGAAEASWMLVYGRPGLGKTALVYWYCTHQPENVLPGIYLRAKVGWTPRSMLAELVGRLGMQPERKKDALFAQVLGLLQREPHAIVVDEVEHALGNKDTIEQFRDISDLTELPIILVGMESVKTKIQKFEQISSRITQDVEFIPASLEDVRIMAQALTHLQISDDLLERILHESQGRYRLIMDALAIIKREARRNNATQINAHDMQRIPQLVRDWRIRNKRPAGKEPVDKAPASTDKGAAA